MEELEAASAHEKEIAHHYFPSNPTTCLKVRQMVEVNNKNLNVFYQQCLRRILGINWRDHVTSVAVLHHTGQQALESIVDRDSYGVWPCCQIMSCGRSTRYIIDWISPGGKRRSGGQKRICHKTIEEDAIIMETIYEGIKHLALNRQQWAK